MGEFNRNRYTFSNESRVVDIGENAIKVREKQISLMIKDLLLFKVLIKDLVGHFPSFKERNLILNIAYYIIEDIELLDKLMERRALPFSRLEKLTKVSRGFLERWQDYILVYIIIFSNPNYKYLQDALNVNLVDETGIVTLLEEVKSDAYRGIVVKVNKRSMIIVTSSGKFVKIRKTAEAGVGCSVTGQEKKGLVHFKFHIALFLLLLTILAFAAYKYYNHTNSTVVINSTSQIKLELNSGNRVVQISSQADKGKDMVQSVNVMDKKIDTALRACIEYAYENDMIPKDGILITITGAPLKYGDLDETGNYVVDKNIQIRINNVGNLYNIYESIAIERKEGNE